MLFVIRERRTPEPVLDLSLFRSGPFAVTALAGLTLNSLVAGFSFVLGQFGSVILSLSPRTIGLLFLPGTLAIAVAVILAGRLIGKYPRPVLITGLLVMVAGGLLMAATATPTMALWIVVLATWLTNLGSLVSSSAVAETILPHAPPGKADADARGISFTGSNQAVDAMRSAMAHSPGTAGYDPNLLRQSGLDLGLDFTNGLRLTMPVVSLLPLALAVAAYLLMPRRTRNAP